MAYNVAYRRMYSSIVRQNIYSAQDITSDSATFNQDGSLLLYVQGTSVWYFLWLP